MNFLPKKVFWSPQNIMLDPTNNCNLQCIMCRLHLLKKKSLSWNYLDFLYVSKQFSPRSISIGATGEPLLNKYVPSMIQNLYEREIKITLNTNGVLLRDVVGEWLNKLDLIKISIDASEDETYREIRCNENFSQLVDTVKKITVLEKPKIRFEYVILSQNYNQIPDFIKFCHNLHVTCFFRLFEGQQLPNIEQFTFIPEIESKLKLARDVAKNLNVQTNLPNLCQKIPYIKQLYLAEKIVDNRRKHICLLPWLQLFVRVDGETAPCCNLLENGMCSTGNIFQNPNVWNSQKMINLRKIFLKKKNYDLFQPCSHCEFMYWKQLISWTKLIPGWFK